ncbi:MAG: hypothetical protein IT427_15785 [Pirellulales bacterium]|nr:hypothetical protein [Pirellulales bacterium]
MPRFVVLRHESPSSHRAGVHWDMMLEYDGALRTWALTTEPAPGASIAAVALPDHRLHYLTYEGPISGDRGEVSRWDEGTYEMRRETLDELVFQLNGNRLTAEYSLRRTPEDNLRWTFRCSPS